ncbi:MAG: sugar ABC transporter permease [Spirochaetales bacterium]|nr:sugar ABC transporter permease [Spirochaetales bacterium]
MKLAGDGNASERRAGLMFVSPAVLFIVAFIAYPTIYNIALSFRDISVTNLLGDQPFIGLANYVRALRSDVFRVSLGNTFVYTAGSIFFQFVIGFALALYFARPFPGAAYIRGLLMVSWLLPLVVTGILWRWILAGDSGLVNVVLMRLGVLEAPIFWFNQGGTAMRSVIVANIWVGVPFNMVLLATGMLTLPTDVYEAAIIDGATTVQRFLFITVPLLRPTIVAVVTLGFIYTFKAFDLILVMTGGGPVNATELLSTLAYRETFDNFNFGYGSAVANLLFLILLFAGVIYLHAVAAEEREA